MDLVVHQEEDQDSVEEEDLEIEEVQEDLVEEEDLEIEVEEDLVIEEEEEEEEELHLIQIEDLYFHLPEKEVKCYEQILLKIFDFKVIKLIGKYFNLLFEGKLIMMVYLDERVNNNFEKFLFFVPYVGCQFSDGWLCVPCG